MFTLEIDLLTGMYRAALPDASGHEWPPHPERVFSALVQSWADGGMNAAERRALEWLEALEPPDIQASGPANVHQREMATVYVPPNDMKGDEISVLPERRPRQARTFAAVAPTSTMIRMQWYADPPDDLARALEALASRIASIGHSSSLVRCAFRSGVSPLDGEIWKPSESGGESFRAAYAGRLADLVRWFSAEGKPLERPRTRRSVRYVAPREQAIPRVPRGHFGGPPDWFVFEGVGGVVPDMLAFPHVARRVRDALMSVAPQPVDEIISGHHEDGAPSARPHLAVVPLANIGWEYSNGDMLGCAIVLPSGIAAESRMVVLQALARFARIDAGETATAELYLTRHATWHLRRTASPRLRSLLPMRWCGVAERWATATPIILDRFPDADDPAGEARLIAAACRHIGLPEPIEIEIHKYSALSGAPSAYPARRPSHPTWTFPRNSKLRDRPRRHAILRFDTEIQGPVLIGAGRYHGFGLCAPLSGDDA